MSEEQTPYGIKEVSPTFPPKNTVKFTQEQMEEVLKEKYDKLHQEKPEYYP